MDYSAWYAVDQRLKDPALTRRVRTSAEAAVHSHTTVTQRIACYQDVLKSLSGAAVHPDALQEGLLLSLAQQHMSSPLFHGWIDRVTCAGLVTLGADKPSTSEHEPLFQTISFHGTLTLRQKRDVMRRVWSLRNVLAGVLDEEFLLRVMPVAWKRRQTQEERTRWTMREVSLGTTPPPQGWTNGISLSNVLCRNRLGADGREEDRHIFEPVAHATRHPLLRVFGVTAVDSARQFLINVELPVIFHTTTPTGERFGYVVHVAILRHTCVLHGDQLWSLHGSARAQSFAIRRATLPSTDLRGFVLHQLALDNDAAATERLHGAIVFGIALYLHELREMPKRRCLHVLDAWDPFNAATCPDGTLRWVHAQIIRTHARLSALCDAPRQPVYGRDRAARLPPAEAFEANVRHVHRFTVDALIASHMLQEQTRVAPVSFVSPGTVEDDDV